MKFKCLLVGLVAGLKMIGGQAPAQELTIKSFENGYVSWNNFDTNLYYTVEYRPNLSEPNLTWDGSHRVSQDVKSTNAIITVPVGMFYRVVGSTNPMHTLTLSPSNGTMAAGYYEAAAFATMDTNLIAGNIRTNVTIFGVAGTLGTAGGGTYPAPVPKTGQTTTYQTGDDGDLEKGVDLPSPRFTVQANTNCVLDNLTGLVWAQNANLASATTTWSVAIAYCEALDYGEQTDWRLPNERELKSLTHVGYSSPALCNTSGTGKWKENDPFTGVQSYRYWSSTSSASSTSSVWVVSMGSGSVDYPSKTNYYYVWPVRGGQ